MVAFTLRNWVNETLSETINAQKSGNPSLPFSQPSEAVHMQVTLCPRLGREQHPYRVAEPRCKPSWESARYGGFGQGKNGHHLHYITISIRKLFVYF